MGLDVSRPWGLEADTSSQVPLSPVGEGLGWGWDGVGVGRDGAGAGVGAGEEGSDVQGFGHFHLLYSLSCRYLSGNMLSGEGLAQETEVGKILLNHAHRAVRREPIFSVSSRVILKVLLDIVHQLPAFSFRERV